MDDKDKKFQGKLSDFLIKLAIISGFIAVVALLIPEVDLDTKNQISVIFGFSSLTLWVVSNSVKPYF